MSQLLDALNAATADDVTALREQIAQKESERANLVAGLDAEIKKLTHAEKFLSKMLGLSPPETRADAEEGDEDIKALRRKPRASNAIDEMIQELETNGPQSIDALATKFGISKSGIIQRAYKSSRIVRRNGLYTLKDVSSKVARDEPDDDDDSERDPDGLATKIFDLLSNEGSMPVPAIAARLKQTEGTVGLLVREHEWFARTNQGEIDIRKSKGSAA